MPVNPYPGTTYDQTHRRWKARATIDGVKRTLGYHDSQELAYAAIQAAKNPMGSLAVPVNAAAIIEKTRKNTKVARHNLLVEAPLALTLLEARCFVLMLRCLHKSDTKPKDIVISVHDLLGDGVLGGHNYELLREALRGLMNVKLSLPVLNAKHDMNEVVLVQALHLDTTNGVIVGKFGENALPYLLNLTDNFTLGEVADLMSIKNPNTHKFYWILKSWEFRSPITVTVEKLRALTTPKGSYRQYADYRNKVLHPSIDELNGLNFEISFTENKKGRAVDSIEFKIAHRTPELAKDAETSATVVVEPKKQLVKLLTPLEDRVSTRLTKLKLTAPQIRKLLEVLAGDEKQLTHVLQMTHPLLVEVETKARPNDNVGATTVQLLKTMFSAYFKAN
jgi:plasmid replication initiation protein